MGGRARIGLATIMAPVFLVFDASLSYADAPAGTIPDGVYSGAIKAIFVLFVLAIVIESTLAVVFNWRPFVETFNARAVRPLIAVAVAFAVVKIFNLDITTKLINATTTEPPQDPSTTGLILTALVIAGGSAAVNHMLVALGYRELKTPETAPKPPPTRAWLAVRAKRVKAAPGDIEVFLGKPSGIAGLPPRVGTIPGNSGSGVLAYFLSDRGRFPPYGGFEVDPASGPYSVVLRSRGPKPAEVTWGPEDVAAGAIVDITLEI
jgi:hypothetical protein